MTDYEYHESDLAPGNDCPLCGEQIVSYGATVTRNAKVEADCWFWADDVEPGNFTLNFNGNVIIINHDPPRA